MQELLERVKAATGPDRDLDCAIFLALDDRRNDDQKRVAPGYLAPSYTYSLDAALDFADRLLKPKLLEVSGGWNPSNPAEWPAWTVRWYPPHVAKDGRSWWAQVETARTPALALIAALLSAVIYEQQLTPAAA